jgi:hypothetical protein
MSSRFLSIALALVLLVSQQLGLQHLLSHGLQGVGSSHAAPAHDEAAAEGLCQTCVATAVLGSATLPAQPCWALQTMGHGAPAAPAIASLRCSAVTPYLARAPPLRA